MSVYRILYNPLSCNKAGEAGARKLDSMLEGELKYEDLTKLDYGEFFASLDPEEKVVLCGGDGTINRFINDTKDIDIKNELYYFAAGTGNDFLFDLGKKPEDGLVDLKPYIKDLPTVTVKGQSSLFINGIGYGIDGYCCEEGDRLRELSDKPVNYTSIAIKGLLGKFKPVNAKVTVDGVTKEYKKVWLAPTMNGRAYGGGMLATPNQDRLNPERTVSTLVYYGVGALRALIVFPSIFKGEHIKHEKMCDVIVGHEVTVEFDRPTALQIDGETVKNVTKYHVRTAK